MDINEFISKFSEQLDLSDVSSITSDTVFRDLDEWSSLTALSVIAMADEEYGVELAGADVRDALTVGDIYQIILKKKA